MSFQKVLDSLEWKEIPQEAFIDDGLPYVTHIAIMELSGIRLKIYKLSNGERVIDEKDIVDFFGGGYV